MTRKLPGLLVEKRAKLDDILRYAVAQCGPGRKDLKLYDVACWLIYALTRADAQETHNDLSGNDDDYDGKRSPADECEETLEMVLDGEVPALWEDVRDLGQRLDPDFDKPINGQDLWGLQITAQQQAGE